MLETLKPLQTVLLIDLLSRGGEEYLKYLPKNQYDPGTHRKPLIKLNLIEETKVKDTINPKTKITILKLSLTDNAWKILQEEIKVLPDIPTVKYFSEVKERFYSKVYSFIFNRNFAFKDVFGNIQNNVQVLSPGGQAPGIDPVKGPGVKKPQTKRKEPKTEKTIDADLLLNKIKSIDKKLFMAGGGLRLKIIRENLKDYPQELIDNLLIELQKQERIVLYRFDLPPGEEDTEAALKIMGEPRHYLYIT